MNSYREQYRILVPEAQAMGMIGVIRSLGRAGYYVIAASTHSNALGLFSNFASEALVSPDYDSGEYADWLGRLVSEKKINVIIPSEGFLLAIRDEYERFGDLMPGKVDQRTVYSCLCKSDVFGSFIKAQPDSPLRKHIPKTLIVTDTVAPEDDLAELGLPIWIKVDAFYDRKGGGSVQYAETISEAQKIIGGLIAHSDKILVQSHETGVKATVNLCLHEGKILARSECLSTHENPHTGGLTALRHNWRHDAMYEDAVARIRDLGWDGVAMMEYKWDAQAEDFTFIEINARYWAGLHVDLYTGIDFPVLQVDAFLGFSPDPVLVAEKFLTVRHTLMADFGYTICRMRDKKIPLLSRAGTFFGFFLLFLNPFIKEDLNFPGDRKLYRIQWMRFLADMLGIKKI